MASELPSVSQAGTAYTSADVMAGHNNSKVLISIDDAALLHSPIEPIRARSLNRLDSLDDGGPEAYRFPSFPRLQKRCNSQLDSIANCSMTHLETNSMSPRVSTDDLTNITRDDFHSRDRLSLGEYSGLIRSVSSRMVDELPPLDFPVTQFERLGHAYLSPNQKFADKLPQPVSRSTSCPSMAYTRRSPSPHSKKSPEPSKTDKPELTVVIDGPADHEGEVPIELPAPSEQNTPGEKRMDQDKRVGDSACEEHPMYTKRLLEKQRQRLSLIKQNGELHQKQTSANSDTGRGGGSGQKVDNYVNMGDIPSAMAERVMDKKVHCTRGVRKKCLQWLNSLDNDDSS